MYFFPRVTALDAVGPYEVLQRLPDATVTFVGHQRGEVRSENGFLGLSVDATFDEVSEPEVVVVPGGIGSRALLTDDVLLEWLRKATAQAFSPPRCVPDRCCWLRPGCWTG